VGPLLKWAGGKRQLLRHIRRFYPGEFNRYIEPFFGSGAVFFDLYALGRLRNREALLIDSNADLIGCYETVRDDAAAVADALEVLAAGHATAGTDHYYAVRDRRFNPLRESRRLATGRIAYTPELAAMLIYLNRTGFNGLFRVNARGGFNVPAGRYVRPSIVTRDKLERVAEALNAPGVRLEYGTYESLNGRPQPGDFLYADPPYAPVSATANFTSYTAAGFTGADQARLQQLVIAAARRGCHVLVSNSTAPEIEALYAGSAEARAAGLRAIRVPARRAINSRASRRGVVDEYLITNVTDTDEGSKGSGGS
jgi:DNA adenine methylase